MTRKIMKFLKFSWDKGEYVDKSRILGLAGKFRLNAGLFSNPAALKTQIWRWKKILVYISLITDLNAVLQNGNCTFGSKFP